MIEGGILLVSFLNKADICLIVIRADVNSMARTVRLRLLVYARIT